MTRPIREIAMEVKANWQKPYFGAVPYINAMLQLNGTKDMYGMDHATSIIAYFLGNANTWRGEAARRIKKELHEMLK